VHHRCTTLQLPQSHSYQLDILNFLMTSVMTPSLWSLHWLKTKERIDYHTFSYLQSPYHHLTLISVWSYLSSTPSQHSFLWCCHPCSSISLKVNNCSFHHASPRLWYKLPKELFQHVDYASAWAAPAFLSWGSVGADRMAQGGRRSEPAQVWMKSIFPSEAYPEHPFEWTSSSFPLSTAFHHEIANRI